MFDSWRNWRTTREEEEADLEKKGGWEGGHKEGGSELKSLCGTSRKSVNRDYTQTLPCL